MLATHYNEIRMEVERKLESVDESGTDPQVRLAATQYVNGLIDAVTIIDKQSGSYLKNTLDSYIDAWACE